MSQVDASIECPIECTIECSLQYDPKESDVVARKCVHVRNESDITLAPGDVSIFDCGRFVGQVRASIGTKVVLLLVLTRRSAGTKVVWAQKQYWRKSSIGTRVLAPKCWHDSSGGTRLDLAIAVLARQ